MTDLITIPSYKQALDKLITNLASMLPADKLAVFNQDAVHLAREFPTPLQMDVGDTAPLFSLPNAHGKPIHLEEQLRQGPVVLTFYRGVWCPYCNLQLKQYQQILPQIKEAGASLIAVSPMSPDNSLSMQDTNALQFEVLSDVGNQVARQYTSIFRYSDASLQAMKDLGYDFFSFYADDTAELPVPATYIINSDHTIRFARSAGGDYRERVEAEAILDALEKK